MKKSIFFLMLVSLSATAFSQKAERQNIRKGNKMYEKEKYTEAEIDYRKSLEVNPNSTQAAFNLGDALYQQKKFEDAISQFQSAGQNSEDPLVKSEALYNMGNSFMAMEDYAKAVETYKRSLMLNPKDDEARFNYAMARRKLQQQQQQQQQDQQNKDQNKEEQQEQEQNKDQQKDQKDQQKEQQNQNQNQDKQDPQQDQNQQQQPQQSDKISKETAEQILNALNQDEKDVQEKVQKAQMQQMKSRKTDKDW